MINLFALSAETTAEETINWGERLSTAGTVTLMGMVTIFVVLTLLWGAIELMHFLLHRGKKQENPSASDVQSVASAESSASSVQNAVAVEDDGAVIAAITAAISAQWEEEGKAGGFRVVSFKRVGKSFRNNF